MIEPALRELLESVRGGGCSVDDALTRLRTLPFEDLGFAKIDHHRALRCGFPEVIYGEGKTRAQVAAIFAKRAAAGGNVLVTRASAETFAAVAKAHPEAQYHEAARAITLRRQPAQPSPGAIAIISAGTADQPVAEEARITAEIMDQTTTALYDVGVAGLHRLLAHAQVLQTARVLIVVAGMEGALASVVGGLVDKPVIAVPTSTGYGASFQGIAPLLTMLNCCAAGVTVVNIDNGFGAGYTAALINRLADSSKSESES